jgi:hypothetical protein
MCEYTEKGVHVGFIDRCIHSTVQALLVILLLVQALIERKPNTIGLARTVYMYTVYDRIRILRIYIICIEYYIIYINIIIPCVRYILCTAVYIFGGFPAKSTVSTSYKNILIPCVRYIYTVYIIYTVYGCVYIFGGFPSKSTV